MRLGQRKACTGPLVAVLTALTLSVSLGGCGQRAVLVEPPAPAPNATDPCTQFAAALPGSLSTVGDRRDVRPESDWTAAYGDPPVAVRCGVGVPAALKPTSTLVTVEGIDWLPEQLTGGWVMTTIGHVAAVEITVPTAQGPAPSVAVDLAPVIEETIPAR